MTTQPDRTLDVSIVVFRSDPTALLRTLTSLAHQTTPPARVRLLINDEDPQRVAEISAVASQLDSTIHVQHPGVNLGFAGGHNRVLAEAFAAGATRCVVLNPDVELEPDALEALVDASFKCPGALISGVLLLGDRSSLTRSSPPLVDSRGTVWTATCRHLDENHGDPVQEQWLSGELRQTAAITGALCLVPREAWQQIVDVSGEFYDEDFFAYREDAELGLRAAMLGIPSIVLQSVVGTHYRGSPGVSRKDPVANRLSVRNRFLLASKYGRRRPGRLPHRLVRDVLTVTAVISTEWSSRSALVEAWRMRHRMREKGARLLKGADRTRDDERIQYA